MDAVRVCDGKRGTGHLKRFFLFLLVDAQGSCKLQQDARRAAKTRNPEPSYTIVASFWSPIRPCELSFGVSRAIFEYRLPIVVFSPQPILERQPVFRERFVSNASLGDALRGHCPEYFMEAACLGLFMVPACSVVILLEHPSSLARRPSGSDTEKRPVRPRVDRK